ncbi:uncharacterized protein F4807DRAFT_354548 [Annulohypoxylon truncatum]|uniref:uncharacterized protein n=1 Tax=Annulohypoxylon truncatum TaxID=327061 RepID=UPI0020084875|nr:uncharacterized protein F4807DRAFT_354548 [Annulohypoxylon truncatum]KAI1204312.1 hypothetical protein F4807DRAFT_354548 [Annulohypoxylon truncatum]
MNKLPLELYDRIVQFVGRRIGEESLPPWEHGTLPFALPAIAAVSRNFQEAVERLTFRNLRVSTSPEDLDVFRRALTPRRQRNLRRLAVHLSIDHPMSRITRPYLTRRFATNQDRRVVNEATTTQLRELFNILAAWRLPGPSLTLEVTGPPLSYETKDNIYTTYLRFSMLDVSGDLVDFPPLPMVKQLYVYSMSCHLHPHLAVSLTAKMPNVSHVDWDLSTCHTISLGLYHYLSRIWRDGLVQSIESTTLPSSVEKFSFKMFVPGTSRFQILPNFIGLISSPDSVSLALRKLTKDCAEVYIDGSIHASLFDPPAVPGTAPHEAAPAWEKATRLEVRASMCGPDGKWLFKIDPNNGTPGNPPEDLDFDRLPPGYGTTESELDEAEEYCLEHLEDIAPETMDGGDPDDGEFFRTEADDGPMNALLAAFARGCGRGNAPALRSATLQSEFFNIDNWPFQVTCYAAGAAAPLRWDAEFAGGDRDAWRVFFHVGDWRPAEETLEEFRRIGRERGGRDTVVCFLPWGNFLD